MSDETGIAWVQQEHPKGCGVACLAMLLGISYAACAAKYPDVDLNTTGVYIEDELPDFGFATAKKYLYRRGKTVDGTRRAREVWPPAPFADLHLCLVTVYEKSPCEHWVLMDRDGDVFDPTTPSRKRLADYFKVLFVSAVVSIGYFTPRNLLSQKCEKTYEAVE